MEQKILNILDKYGSIIVQNYRDKIASHITSGDLNRSITYVVDGSKDEFTITISLLAYYQYLERGRRPGKQPPLDAILKWVKTKNIIPKPYSLPSGKKVIPTERSLAFLIARSIGRNGLPAHNYMLSSIQEVQEAMIKEICRVMATEITLEIIQPFR